MGNEVVCKYCGKEFTTSRNGVMYCSDYCRKRFSYLKRKEELNLDRISLTEHHQVAAIWRNYKRGLSKQIELKPKGTWIFVHTSSNAGSYRKVN